MAYPRKLHSLQLQEEIMPSEQTECIILLLAQSIEELEAMHKELTDIGQNVEDFISYKVQQKLEAALFLLQDEIFGMKEND